MFHRTFKFGYWEGNNLVPIITKNQNLLYENVSIRKILENKNGTKLTGVLSSDRLTCSQSEGVFPLVLFVRIYKKFDGVQIELSQLMKEIESKAEDIIALSVAVCSMAAKGDFLKNFNLILNPFKDMFQLNVCVLL